MCVGGEVVCFRDWSACPRPASKRNGCLSAGALLPPSRAPPTHPLLHPGACHVLSGFPLGGARPYASTASASPRTSSRGGHHWDANVRVSTMRCMAWSCRCRVDCGASPSVLPRPFGVIGPARSRSRTSRPVEVEHPPTREVTDAGLDGADLARPASRWAAWNTDLWGCSRLSTSWYPTCGSTCTSSKLRAWAECARDAAHPLRSVTGAAMRLLLVLETCWGGGVHGWVRGQG